jgi:Tfp pilus assembly major pilin PilA
MKNIFDKIFYSFIVLSLAFALPEATAQTFTPLAEKYIACADNSVEIGFIAQPNVIYRWFNELGVFLVPGNGYRNIINRTKDASPIQTFYAEPYIITEPSPGVFDTTICAIPRIAVEIELSDNCGSVNPTGCYANGILLFNEDYGGNLPTSPAILPYSNGDRVYNGIPYYGDGIPQVTGWNWHGTPATLPQGGYIITKNSYAVSQTHSGTWWNNIGDHTSLGDDSRGYFFICDASQAQGQFYELQIDNLCVGTELMFSAWLVSLCKSNHIDKAKLKFIVEDTAGNVLIIYYTGDLTDDIQSPTMTTAIWRNYGFKFITPTPSVKLRILNAATGTAGNDFCMDDIQVRHCAPEVTLSTYNISVCEGSPANVSSTFVNSGYFSDPLEYQWYYSTTSDMTLTNWTADPTQQGETLNKNIFAADTGYYRLAISGAGDNGEINCAAWSNPVHIGITDGDVTEFSATICEGESYDFDGPKTVSGVYVRTVSVGGTTCETVERLTLTVLQTQYYDTLRICSSQIPYNYHNNQITAAGDDVFMLPSASGCDSTVNLNVIITTSITETVDTAICINQLPFNWRGINYPLGTVTNTYTYTRTTSAGCDSIVTLNLTVNPRNLRTINDTICNGGSYDFYGQTLTLPNTYTHTATATTGCDTVITLNLTVNPINLRTINDTICNGGSYDFYGQTLTLPNTYTHTATATTGCDTVVTLNLAVSSVLTRILNDTICNGGSYDFYGQTLTLPNTYTHTATSITGCDTVVTLNLTVNLPTDTTINAVICLGQTYNQNGFFENAAGTHERHETNTAGCDSTIYLNLTVNLPTDTTITDSICAGDTYNKNGFFTAVAGTHVRTEPNFAGCDSTITLILTYSQSHTFFDTLSICRTDLPYTYTLPNTSRDTIFGINTISDTYQFGTVCDGVRLELTISPLTTVLNQQLQYPICADDNDFWVKFAFPTDISKEVPPTNYQIVFSPEARAAGFTDIPNGDFNGTDEISIPIHQPIYPDRYNFTITMFDSVNNCGNIVKPVDFDVYYPDSIMKQKWDDVISLLNSYYNGGFDFTGYQWYKNGEELVGKTASYIYLGTESLIPGDEYYVYLTRPDGSKMFSCPITATIPKPTVSEYPKIVTTGNTIQIYFSKDNATARLWTVTGILLQTSKTKAPMHTMEMPQQRGAYLLEILYEENSQRYVELIRN